MTVVLLMYFLSLNIIRNFYMFVIGVKEEFRMTVCNVW